MMCRLMTIWFGMTLVMIPMLLAAVDYWAKKARAADTKYSKLIYPDGHQE